MLKISIVDRGAERRLVLEGALIPPSVMDLRIAWLRACAGRQGRRIVFVFRNVTHISAEGEAALWELMNREVRFSSEGVPAMHILQQLKRKDENVNHAAHTFTARDQNMQMEIDGLRRGKP